MPDDFSVGEEFMPAARCIVCRAVTAFRVDVDRLGRDALNGFTTSEQAALVQTKCSAADVERLAREVSDQFSRARMGKQQLFELAFKKVAIIEIKGSLERSYSHPRDGDPAEYYIRRWSKLFAGLGLHYNLMKHIDGNLGVNYLKVCPVAVEPSALLTGQRSSFRHLETAQR